MLRLSTSAVSSEMITIPDTWNATNTPVLRAARQKRSSRQVLGLP
jgi:hypothetical protein